MGVDEGLREGRVFGDGVSEEFPHVVIVGSVVESFSLREVRSVIQMIRVIMTGQHLSHHITSQHITTHDMT